MATNALLIRWNGGWTEVTDTISIGAHGRLEGLLGIGAVRSLDEVTRIATGQLAIFADERTMITAGTQPRFDAECPYLGYGVGDTVLVPDVDGTPTSERIVALAVTEDSEGEPVFTPTLHDVILTEQERFNLAIKKMLNGTLHGQSTPATPAAAVAQLDPTCCPPVPSHC